jgi:UDP-N-acetylmuramoyl-tripeptide--D-alanyl-D-alanine ligase
VGSLFLPDAEAAGRWLQQTLRPGDVVLVKGSRGVHLERAIEALKEMDLTPQESQNPSRNATL